MAVAVYLNFTIFLSTPSARRATSLYIESIKRSQISIHALREEGDRRSLQSAYRAAISIHALREEGDHVPCALNNIAHNFYPRPPRGGRRGGRRMNESFMRFLSTPSARRATDRLMGYIQALKISIHALREEGDGRMSHDKKTAANFYPRPPRGGRQQKQRQNLCFQTNYTTFCTNLEEP